MAMWPTYGQWGIRESLQGASWKKYRGWSLCFPYFPPVKSYDAGSCSIHGHEASSLRMWSPRIGDGWVEGDCQGRHWWAREQPEITYPTFLFWEIILKAFIQSNWEICCLLLSAECTLWYRLLASSLAHGQHTVNAVCDLTEKAQHIPHPFTCALKMEREKRKEVTGVGKTPLGLPFNG